MKYPKKTSDVATDSNWIPVLVITFLVFIAYVNGWGNGFSSDDIPGILNNTQIDNLKVIFSNPLIALRPFIYYVLYETGGKDPVLFRSLNMFFHLGTALLSYSILKKMSDKWTALLAASLFAVHPITVESVTWISAGSYTQYAFFLMLSIWFFSKKKQTYITYSFSLISFVIATFSSEKALIYPLILLLFLFVRKQIRKRWLALIPFFSISGLWSIWFVSRIQERIHIQQAVYYQSKGFDNPLVQIPIAISNYLELLFWPDRLSLYHSELAYSNIEFSIRVAVTVLFFLAIVFSYKKSKFIFFWLLFFVITLIPTMLPLRISWIVAERYVYMGTIGVLASVSYLLIQLKRRLLSTTFYVLITILFIALLTRTIIRNMAWMNDETLFLATARTAPSDFKTHNNLGWVYQKRGDYTNAIKSFRKAIAINPYYVDGTNNLALTYMIIKDYVHALYYFKKTIALNPGYIPAYGSIGTILIEQKKYKEAIEYFSKSIKLDPKYIAAYHNLGKAYEMEGNTGKAIAMYKRVLELNPNVWQTHMNLGALYFGLYDYKSAEKYTLKAHQLNPSNVDLLISLTKIYIKLQDEAHAKLALTEALRLDHSNKEALDLLKDFPQ